MTRLLLALWLASVAAGAAGNSPSYAERPEVQEFIREVSARHGFDEKELTYLFSKVHRTEPVLEAIQPPPPKARSWEEYRANFVNPRRIAAGKAFWKTHRRALARAERRYGVPAEYIVAIIGVETFYGRYAGRWRVVDALTTLAFDYAPRSPYFRSELEHYLLLSRDTGGDVFAVRGSYAGAIGIPQFMPSSTRRFAVDFDGSGSVDLRRSPADAIGSVANFLKEHGWRSGEEVLFEAKLSGEAWRPLADGSVNAKHTLDELRKAGVEFEAPGAGEARAALVELETPERPSEYRVGLHNFYVLTRYNRSAFYASAVHDLAHELKKGQVLGK
ncbi:MAG TPA: lytic murein transglycosylase B [Burkholderiales bacterium]|nr:lytic murein transglycosylase B [Burkholderiales bacterium]